MIQLIIPLEFIQYFHKVFLSKILLNASIIVHPFIQQILIDCQRFQAYGVCILQGAGDKDQYVYWRGGEKAKSAMTKQEAGQREWEDGSPFQISAKVQDKQRLKADEVVTYMHMQCVWKGIEEMRSNR